MKVFYKFINGFKVRFCRAYFCIGIGMDQFTPVYYRYTTGQSLGPVKKQASLYSPQKQTVKPQSESLAKNNYGRRARHKN
jgi:hypothetical protein